MALKGWILISSKYAVVVADEISTTDKPVEPEELMRYPEMQIFGENAILVNKSAIIKHVLTHQHLFIRFIQLKHFPEKLNSNWFYTDINNLQNLALPQAIFIFIKKFFNF